MKKVFKWLAYGLLAFIASIAVVFILAYAKREEIKQLLIAEFNDRINGSFAVEKVQFTIFHNFPDFSISLQGVTLHDTISIEPVLSADKIFLDIGLTPYP